MKVIIRTCALLATGLAFGCGRGERSSGTPTAPLLSPSTAKSASKTTPPVAAPSTSPPTSLCSVAEDPTKVTDWVRTLGEPFRIEYGGLWALLRIHRPASALAEVERLLGTTYSEGDDTLIPCGAFVLFWKACATCATSDDTLKRIEKHVGKIDLLRLFEYHRTSVGIDCLNDRLPKSRCQHWFRGLSKVKDCGVWKREERIQANKMLIHLDLEPPDSTACLRPHDLQSHQPVTPTTNPGNAPASTAEIDPLLLP